MSQDKLILTVTQLNEYIKSKIDSDQTLSNLWIKGEVSNFVHHKSGHLYFTLKDEGSLVRALMFSSSANKLLFKPENGMKVVMHGRVASYVRDGIYNFYADSIEPDGIGALYIAYEQLKKKLDAEGLFRPENKKLLPKIPTRIGVITSPTGAAVRDIINVISRRFPYAKIVIYPALVQGDGAPPQLIAGIQHFNTTNSADVIILGRGGGSIEDLWAFNNEVLAREIFASRIPIISAVGHETDFTICDFVADRRAPTPSAAAEIAVPETVELQRKISNIIGKTAMLITMSLNDKHKSLTALADSKALRNPLHILDEKKTRLIFDTEKLENAIRNYTHQKKNLFDKNASKLEALNPLSVLLRGFSAVFGKEGKLIKSVDDVTVGDTLSLRTADGTIRATVNELQHKNTKQT